MAIEDRFNRLILDGTWVNIALVVNVFLKWCYETEVGKDVLCFVRSLFGNRSRLVDELAWMDVGAALLLAA